MTEMQDFEVLYRGYSDDQLAQLSKESDTLTESARSALSKEIERRGLKADEILHLQQEQTTHIESVDLERKQYRKALVVRAIWRSIFWVVAVALFVAFCMFFKC
jgi:hypothetical protein